MFHFLLDGFGQKRRHATARPHSVQAESAAHPRLILVVTIMASSLAFIDGSVTNVALPKIGRSLAGAASDLSWIVNAYLLPLAALLLMGGAAGDRYGHRRMLEGGVGLFVIASVGCALSTGVFMLLVCRAMQGVGAALLTPASLALLGATFQGEERGHAVGTWAAAGAIAGAVGPPFGGWLVEAVGWRSIFFINLPLGIFTLVLARRVVPRSSEGDAPLDWPGGLCATAALGLLTWALTAWSGGGGVTSAVTAGLGAGIALAVVFLLVERRRGDRAMMPLGLFTSRIFVGLNAATLLLYSALGALMVLLPYVLIVGGGWSPAAAGLSLLPFSLIVGVGSRMAGRLAERSGSRLPLTLGPLAAGAGLLLLAWANPSHGYLPSFLPGIVVMATGMAAAIAPLTTAVLSAADDRLEGTAAGFNSAVARVGGLVATALAAGVMAKRGAPLINAFHLACAAGAVASLTASALSFRSLRSSAVRVTMPR